MSALTEPQKNDALILHAQGDTPEVIARHLGVEVKNLPAAIRRKATQEPDDATPDAVPDDDELDDATPDDDPDDDDPDDATPDDDPDDES